MGVRVDEVAVAISVPTRPVSVAAPVPDGEGLDQAAVFAIDARLNNSVRLVNRLLAAGARVERLAAPLGTTTTQWPLGTFLVSGQRSHATAGPARRRHRRPARARPCIPP